MGNLFENLGQIKQTTKQISCAKHSWSSDLSMARATSIQIIKLWQPLIVNTLQQSRWVGTWMNEVLFFLFPVSSPFNVSNMVLPDSSSSPMSHVPGTLTSFLDS